MPPTQHRPHPTALAFFHSLDKEQNKTSSSTTNDDNANSVLRRKKRSPGIERIASTLGWRGRHSQSQHYPIEMNSNDGISIKFNVTQIQRGEVEGGFGTGATVWPAALVLIKYLEKLDAANNNRNGNSGNNKLFGGKTVADLGAGTGVTSIVAALLGAKLVICTDGSPAVVDLAKDNVLRVCDEIEKQDDDDDDGMAIKDEASPPSSCDTQTREHGMVARLRGSEIRVRDYQWGDGTMLSELGKGQDHVEQTKQDSSSFFDVVLVSDCVLPKLYPIPPLVDAMDELMGPDSIAYLSYEHRHYAAYDPRDKFRDLAMAKGFVVRVVPLEDHDPIYSVDDIEIWEVRRNRC